MKRYKLILAILAIAASSLLFVIPCTGNRVDASAAQADREASVQPFLNDVFVVDGGFLRHPDGSTPSDALLRNVDGTPLGVTWGQFKSASSEVITVGKTSRARNGRFLLRSQCFDSPENKT
jgi:hypothetical protein